MVPRAVGESAGKSAAQNCQKKVLSDVVGHVDPPQDRNYLYINIIIIKSQVFSSKHTDMVI